MSNHIIQVSDIDKDVHNLILASQSGNNRSKSLVAKVMIATKTIFFNVMEDGVVIATVNDIDKAVEKYNETRI